MQTQVPAPVGTKEPAASKLAPHKMDMVTPDIAKPPEVLALLRQGAAVSFNASGGKDSAAAAIATFAYLDQIGHSGPRAVIHADLGMVEWSASRTECERLARSLGIELMVVGRSAGGLMERWESRWESSVRRYRELETVTLVLPWSTAKMRFCTSELKARPINAANRRRFKGLPIVNVTGVRREESAGRALGAPWSRDALSRPTAEYLHWRPINDWRLKDVIDTLDAADFPLHPAYTEFSMGRVSCAFCILANIADLRRSASNPEHRALYRRMVELEARSTFGLQGSRWLADVSPDLLSASERAAVARAKEAAELRVTAERQLPRELLFVSGRPQRMPTAGEADLLACTRRSVAQAVGIAEMRFVTRDDVITRYRELLRNRHSSWSPAIDPADGLAPSNAGGHRDLFT